MNGLPLLVKSKKLESLDETTDMVVSITEAARSPWFNMVKQDSDGFLKVIMEKKETTYIRRQDTPAIYDMTTVAYVTRPGFIKNAAGIFDGQVRGVEIPVERAIDIDTELDFKIAEFLIQTRSKHKATLGNAK